MENKLTVSDIPITLRRGTYNIINCGIRTGKTFWATHSLQSHTRDGNLNRILMLVDCIATRDSIIPTFAKKRMNGGKLGQVGVKIQKKLVLCVIRLLFGMLSKIILIF